MGGNTLLLSLRPEFAELVFAGVKKVEFDGYDHAFNQMNGSLFTFQLPSKRWSVRFK
jgi:hypothetical protein